MGLGALASLINAPLSGDSQGAVRALQHIQDVIMQLLTEGVTAPKEEAALAKHLEHPMFQAFLKSERGQELRSLSNATRKS